MSGTSGTTGPEPGPEPGPEQVRYSVAAAAQRLGITERAVRKRIAAGTLRSEPQGRSYWVYLEPGPEGPEPGPVPQDRNGPEPAEPTASQITPAREASTIALVQAMLAPFIADLGETKEQLGRVTAERDALQARVRELEAAQVESSAPAANADPDLPPRAWWQVWRR